MPSDYFHGIQVVELNDGVRSLRTVETGIIGVVVTANDADPETFPLNKTVMCIGTHRYIDKAGTQGTLAMVLDAIKDQIEPIIYVHRVEEDKDPKVTISNVIGSVKNGQRLGLQSLLVSRNQFGHKCRIIGAPGWDKHQSVATEIGIIAEKLRAFAYIGVSEKLEKLEDVTGYRKNFGNKRQMLIWPDFVGWDSNSHSEIMLSASARALGLRSKIDNDIGWHKTLSNVNVNGVDGISKDLYYDALAAKDDTWYLNSQEITTIIREDGFKFWGSRTCSDEPLFAFENYTRTGDVLADTIALGTRWAVDKPMSVPLFRDVMDAAELKMRDLTQRGYLLGGEVWFDGDLNPKHLLKIGKATIDYNYTPVPPLEGTTFNSRITDKHIVNLITALTRG